MSSPVLELTQALMRCASVTPDDAGCQRLIAQRLSAIDFEVRHLRIGDVDNLIAHRGTSAPRFMFAGHTDVVPTGPLEHWDSAPFDPQIRQGHLYGRGAADMKSSLAAMVVACERYVASNPNHEGQISFLITSDEEGPAINGTQAVIAHLPKWQMVPDYCLVGEPSSNERLGDVVRIGRRGSLNGVLTVQGVQGHVAYPTLADNPIHRAIPALTELAQRQWDQGNEHYPPTSFQISNLEAGTGATNVIPASAVATFNFRYSTEQTADALQSEVGNVLARQEITDAVEWTLSGEPFLTAKGALIDAVVHSCRSYLNVSPELSTSGGTSDGRFIAPMGTQVVELGPCNATIHKLNECVAVDDLDPLAELYRHILAQLLGGRV